MDLIDRQAAIDAIMNVCKRTCTLSTHLRQRIEQLPSAEPEVIACGEGELSAQPEPCDLCKKYGLEDGDTLYCSADWDGGIGFDYIRDIHYCPKCGRRLGNERSN